IDLVELYNAMQQGVVDGQDNPLETIFSRSYNEVQKYLSLTNHSNLNYIFVANKQWFDDLPEHLQEAVLEAGRLSAEAHNAIRVKEESEMLAGLKEKGMIVNELTEEGFNKFVEASKS